MAYAAQIFDLELPPLLAVKHPQTVRNTDVDRAALTLSLGA